MNKKRWWALAIFAVLLIVWSVSLKGAQTTQPTSDSGLLDYLNKVEGKTLSTQVYREGKGDTLAMLKLEGTIVDNSSNSISSSNTYNHQIFLKQLEAAYSRDDIKGIILQINSPGGGVYESDEIYNQIMNLKAKYKKPLLVYMGQTAASGGYYVSVAADKIYANRNTITGSIGVIISTYNYQQLADKIGIQDVIFKSGANKDLLNPMRPVTEQERAIMQGLIDETYGYFVDIVAKGRNMDRNKVQELADGRIYTATQAKNLGLIDEVGYLDQAIEETARLANTSDPQVLLFENAGYDLFTWLNSVKSPSFDLLGLKEQLDQQSSTRIMYIAQ